MVLIWTEQLSVGNAIIDSEHKSLIGMVNGAEHALRKGDDSALLRAFGQLENWLTEHFANEEKIAQAIKFSSDQHKLAQQYSLKELQFVKAELETKDGMWSESAVEHFSRVLRIWAIDHIARLDAPMKQVLQSHPYDLKPD